ncbi:MAG: hypothetical protein KAQ62_04675, partial [Cyclobacteriaceae bacterium]|nr:hypothetical protein [Cyclobacteriaceae bacterium]
DEENIDSLQNDYIWSLEEDNHGVIWMGTSGDVHKYDPTTKKFSIFDQYPGYQKVSVHHITKDLEGNLLFVGNGISYLEMETGRLKQFNMSNGVLNSDGCSCALIDNNGDIWAADGKGILKIDTDTGESRRFDITDGLQDWIFNNSSCFKGKDGILYFGGNKGFNSFHPDSVNVSGYMPPVSLTNFQLFNEDIPLIHEVSDSASSELIYKLPKTIQSMEQLTLPYNAFVMSFEYASMDFASAEKNEYQYMLENFDYEWNKVGIQRKATYTNLSPGAYVFRVKGTNNDGVWSHREVALPITILPPWWLTWWMKTIYWILGIGGPLAFYFTRISVLKKQKAKLELQVRERTREVVEQKEEIETQAEELQASNDQLVALDGFKEAMTGMVVHDFKNSLNTIINFSEDAAGNPKMRSIRQAGK